MFKKLILMIGCVFTLLIQADSDHTFSIVAATTVIAGTGVYLAMRESNIMKIERAENWLKYYAGGLHYDLAQIVTLKDMQKFVQKPTRFKKEIQVFCDEVARSYVEINARYGSWIKPWNWNAVMKHTYVRIKELYQTTKLINMMFKYQPMIISWSDDLDELVIVKSAQMICQGESSYPLIYCAQMMKEDLKFLHKTQFKISCDIALIDMLETLKEFIVSTQTYVEEKRIQEQVKLQERQAYAQEVQAAAQLAQAQAQKERNQIEKEKLKKKK